MGSGKERKIANNSRRIRFAGDVERPADWFGVDRELLVDTICKAARQGGALRFGYTRDGGAYAIGIYGDGDPYTVYVRPSENLATVLRAIGHGFEGDADEGTESGPGPSRKP